MSRWQKLISYVWGAMGWPAALLETGQTTCYAVGDDGDYEAGIAKAYTVNALAGNTNIEVAHYAAATISFTLAGSVVADAANGLATILTGDTVVIKGSVANDGVYTVAAGGVAAQFTTVQPLVNEAAGAVVKIYKRAAHSNNVVTDDNTGLVWSRYTNNGERVGPTSDGKLNWYDVATRWAIYAGANTISVIMPGNIFRVIGGAALTRFHVGDCIMAEGFANGVNNLPFYRILSVTVNGLDLDIEVQPQRNDPMVAEGAVGDTIYLNCRSVDNYAAGANLAGLSGHTDWRVPNITELVSIMDEEAPNGYPDAVAFPAWYREIWSSTTVPGYPLEAHHADYLVGRFGSTAKTAVTRKCTVVRGGL